MPPKASVAWSVSRLRRAVYAHFAPNGLASLVYARWRWRLPLERGISEQVFRPLMSLHLPIRWRSRATASLLLAFATTLAAGACQSAECAPGLDFRSGRCIDPTQPGECEPCGVHAFCDASVMPNACSCAPGYEGNPCSFAGLIVDPGFEEAINIGPWADDGGKGATVLPTVGDRDPGEGALAGSVICSAGSLVQTIRAPSLELAEPLVVEVNYMAEGVHGLAVGFGRSWTRLRPDAPSWRSETFCLGEGAYGESPNGGEVEVRISASERQANCYELEPGSEIRIDHFTIRPAGEISCPAPGDVVNGAAELDGEPWGFFTDGNVEAELEAGVGHLGSSGASIARDAGESGRATMTTQLSVPLPSEDDPPPALRFWWRGKSGGLYDVALGTMVDLDDRGRQADTLAGTGSGLDRIYCLPPWTHGSVLDLSFSLTDEGASAVELVVDDVTLTTDPDCGTEEDLLDPSFESAPNSWVGVAVHSSLETVVVQSNSELARSGDGLMELSYENADANLAMETYVLVPQNDGEDGPAVTFYSRSPATLSTEVQWVLGRSEVERGDLQTEVTWEPNEVCLPPQWAGRWFGLQVRVGSPEGLVRQERVLLDDFSLGTSPNCTAD